MASGLQAIPVLSSRAFGYFAGCYYGVQRLCAARCERGRGRADGQLCNVDSVEVAVVKKDPNAKRLKRSGRLP